MVFKKRQIIRGIAFPPSPPTFSLKPKSNVFDQPRPIIPCPHLYTPSPHLASKLCYYFSTDILAFTRFHDTLTLVDHDILSLN